jgi:hypothetical protein
MRLEHNKIPIWENKRRIKELQFFREIYLLGVFGTTQLLTSAATGKPFTAEECRSEINRRLPAVKEMVRLAGISALRDWPTIRKDDSPARVDVLEQIWYVEKLRLSFRAPSDVVDEAIGVYQADQSYSWIRTCNPFFWLGRLIDWLVGGAFNVVALFGGNPQAARNSPTGRFIFGVGKIICGLIFLLAATCTVIEFLGFQTPVRHFLHLP